MILFIGPQFDQKPTRPQFRVNSVQSFDSPRTVVKLLSLVKRNSVVLEYLKERLNRIRYVLAKSSRFMKCTGKTNVFGFIPKFKETTVIRYVER